MGTGSCVSLVFKPGPGTSSLPPTVKTWLDNWFGFDGVLQQSPRVVWVNGGLLDGAQAAVSVGSNLTFVVMFGRSGLSSTDPDFQWFPNWSILLGQAPRAPCSRRTACRLCEAATGGACEDRRMADARRPNQPRGHIAYKL
jgi:hypothetical protein